MSTPTSLVVLTVAQLQGLVRTCVEEALSEALPEAIRRAMEKPLMTKTEVMQLTGWSSRKIEYLKAERKVTFIRQGRTVLFPREELMAFLDEGRVPARDDG